jgi:hypothetical protein
MARCAYRPPDQVNPFTAELADPTTDRQLSRAGVRLASEADFMKSHLDSHHPFPIKTAL